MARDDEAVEAARAAGVQVDIDPKGGTMHIRFPPSMEVDLYADIIRSDNRDDPVEAGRQIWNEVAPTLRKCGWTDEQIIKVYGIPDEVLSGEAERRAGVRMWSQRLTWIVDEPGKMYRGEGRLISRLQAGEITIDAYAEAMDASYMDMVRRAPAEGEVADLPEADLHVTVEGGPDPKDWVKVTVYHVPSGRRNTGRMTRQFVDSTISYLTGVLAVDLWLIGKGQEPFHEDNPTPADERIPRP